MNFGLSFILSYLLGSIPTGYIIVRIKQHKDIRQLGSGNVGALNVFTIMGWKSSLIVFLCDLVKGIGAVCLCFLFGVNPSIGLVMSVIGHIYPVWLKFRGGKGLTVALGGVLALGIWQVVIVFPLTWLIFYLLICKKNMDVSNLMAAFGVAVYGFIANLNYGLIIMAAVVMFKHYQVLKQ